MKDIFGRCNAVYTKTAVICLNALILIALINIGLGLVFAIHDLKIGSQRRLQREEAFAPRPGQPAPHAQRTDYQMMWVDTRAYPPGSGERVERMLLDFYAFQPLGFRFNPYTHFSNAPFTSKTLNIELDSQGFDYRRNGAQVLNPALDVFIFGGSTTFGVHVADEWTLASFLEEELGRRMGRKVRVWNYGRPTYSWYQEMVLFQRLIHAGRVPHWAIFVDGVNALSADGNPLWSDALERLWEEKQLLPRGYHYPKWLPVFRLANYLHDQRRVARLDQLLKERRRPPLVGTAAQTQGSYLTAISQISAVAERFKIRSEFFLQPARAYECDGGHYSRPINANYAERVGGFYQLIQKSSGHPFHDLSHFCLAFPKDQPLFVDDVHYSPSFAKVLAHEMARRLVP